MKYDEFKKQAIELGVQSYNPNRDEATAAARSLNELLDAEPTHADRLEAEMPFSEIKPLADARFGIDCERAVGDEFIDSILAKCYGPVAAGGAD